MRLPFFPTICYDFFMSLKFERLYLALATLFSVIVIVSNLVTVKLISLPFTTLAIPCGLVAYPISFLVGDLITEIYGERRAKFIVYVGFAMAMIAFLIIKLALILPPHPQWVSINNSYGFSASSDYQNAFAAIFDINGIALVSSMLGYAAAQLMDIKLFAFLGELTKSKHLWIRNCGSTLASQVIDTLVVNVLLLYCGLKLDLALVIKISLICYIYKGIITVCNIPMFYLAVWGAKKFLGQHQLSFSEQAARV